MRFFVFLSMLLISRLVVLPPPINRMKTIYTPVSSDTIKLAKIIHFPQKPKEALSRYMQIVPAPE